MKVGRVIKTPADLARGADWLATQEPRFALVLKQTGALPLRLRPPGFGTLLEMIVSQQVSVASANAIRARMAAAGAVTPDAVTAAGEDGLRAAGLSRPKIRYALALAEADVDYTALHQMPDDEVIKTLCALMGIGPWTAQIYVMFALGRADGFAAGDLALQEAARALFDLAARPTAEELERRAEAWRPWRSVAARALFAYYRILKSTEGL